MSPVRGQYRDEEYDYCLVADARWPGRRSPKEDPVFESESSFKGALTGNGRFQYEDNEGIFPFAYVFECGCGARYRVLPDDPRIAEAAGSGWLVL